MPSQMKEEFDRIWGEKDETMKIWKNALPPSNHILYGMNILRRERLLRHRSADSLFGQPEFVSYRPGINS